MKIFPLPDPHEECTRRHECLRVLSCGRGWRQSQKSLQHKNDSVSSCSLRRHPFLSLSLSLMLSLSYSLWLSLSASMLSFCVFVFAESAVFVSFIPTCTASAATFHRRATFKRFLQTTSRSAVRSYDRNRPYNFFLSLPLSLPLPIFGGFYFSLHGVSNAGTSNDCDDEDFFVARGLECE